MKALVTVIIYYLQVELNIEILDENDVSPIFTQPFGYAIAIPEDTAVASTITTSVSTTVRYSICAWQFHHTLE